MNRFFYCILLCLILPLVPLKLLWRGIKQPAYLRHWAERFGFYGTQINKRLNKPNIWLHCVSVGETRAAEPLVKQLQTTYPNHQILLTHGTPTGRDASEGIFGNLVTSVYLPYDLPFAVNNFLNHFKPQIGLIMETELWFNLIAVCKQRSIPMLLLNARLSEKSASGYAKLGKLVQEGLQNLSAIAAQTEDDAARFNTLGAKNISVAGNLKFDVKPPADAVDKGLQLRKQLGKKTVFLAASTRDGEEALILEAVKDLNILTIIVPRHPQRFDEVAALFKQDNIAFQRKSELNNIGLQPNTPGHPLSNSLHEFDSPCTHEDSRLTIILGDTMGELFNYYAACDFCFIGGSLLNYGGQNLIEAAQLAKPIIIGEHTFNFADAANNAVQMGAALRVNNVASLREQIILLGNDLNLRKKMQQNALVFSQTYTGATTRLMQLIADNLPIK